ncbi:MAG TPA: hypothetical protein VIL36_23300 [Acidimicrobiales bacterium]|jgi:hypothetical protein
MEVFPVQITIDGHTHATCKMFVDATGTRIYRWDPTARAGVPVLETPAVAQGGPRTWRIETGDGELKVTKAGGCGCSNPLKRWRPDPGAARAVAG